MAVAWATRLYRQNSLGKPSQNLALASLIRTSAFQWKWIPVSSSWNLDLSRLYSKQCELREIWTNDQWQSCMLWNEVAVDQPQTKTSSFSQIHPGYRQNALAFVSYAYIFFGCTSTQVGLSLTCIWNSQNEPLPSVSAAQRNILERILLCAFILTHLLGSLVSWPKLSCLVRSWV